MITSKSVRIQLQLQKIIFIVLLLSIIGVLGWLSQQHSVQYDWSANKRNSISQSSIDVLNSMPDDIIVNIYVQDDEMTHEAVTEIMQRYQREKANFIFRLINPDIDIELAKKDDIKQYGQIVIRYKNKLETISSLSERIFSSSLLRLGHSDDRKIVFLTGHGERDPAETNNRGYSELTKQLQNNGFKVHTLNLLQGNIDDDTNTFVIAAPSHDILDGEIDKIKNYIDAGGNLLWLVDPGELHGMGMIADKLGLQPHHGIIIDNNTDLRKTLQIEHPAIIPVVEYYPHKVTQDIKYNTLFPTSRGIDSETLMNENAWQSSKLFASFEQSWSEAKGITSTIVFESEDGDIPGPITIALALERSATTDSMTKQRVIAVGDSDFLANSYIGTGANLSLGFNMMSWLVGENDLISVEPKGAPDTKLILTDAATIYIGVGFFFVIPAALILSGFIIWYKRRRA